MSIFSLEFLNWLERNVPHTYQRLVFIFTLERDAWIRLMSLNGHPEISRGEFEADISSSNCYRLKFLRNMFKHIMLMFWLCMALITILFGDPMGIISPYHFKTMMDTSAWCEEDILQFRRLLAIEDDLRVHIFRVEEGLGNLDPSSGNFLRLQAQFAELVAQLRDLQSARRTSMRHYGLPV